MMALVFTIGIMICMCSVVASWFGTWTGIALFVCWLFGIFWIFYTLSTKGKTAKSTIVDWLAITPVLPVCWIFGMFNYIFQETMGLP